VRLYQYGVLPMNRSGAGSLLTGFGSLRHRDIVGSDLPGGRGTRPAAVIGSIGLLAPAGTPMAIVEQIAGATRTALADPVYQQWLIEAGNEPTVDASPEKFRRMLAKDIALLTPVVKALALKID
jgi:tripartite-type tricarboxylate transporter receptor subunit TctC